MSNFTRAFLPMAFGVFGIAAASAADFVVDGLQYSTLSDSTVTVKKYMEGIEVKIPAKVTDPSNSTEYSVVQIERSAFYQAGVQSVSVPGSVKKIEPYAFWKSSMESISLAEGLEGIGHAAFKECTKLATITLPSTLKELGFMWTLTGVDGSTFAGCLSLREIEIPASIEHIPEQTFLECASLSKVTINEGTTSLGERVFELCPSLKSIEMPKSVVTWERGVFNKTGLVNPVVPGQIKVIPNSAFIWCHDIKSFTIEEGVEEIGKQSFADCGGFTTITVPNSTEWIRSDAFQGNELVTEVYIGSGVRRMGHACLALWAPDEKTNTPHWALEAIHIASPVPPVHEQNDDHFDLVEDDFFFGGKEFTEELRAKFYSEVKLYVPESAIQAYKEAEIWKNFTQIIAKNYGGVDGITADSNLRIENGVVYSDQRIEAYTMSGILAGYAEGQLDLNLLGKGMYVVRSGNKTVKTTVR